VIKRRAILQGLLGLAAGLVAGVAEAKPPRPSGVYSDTYSDSY
jgi:hypothetical protein